MNNIAPKLNVNEIEVKKFIPLAEYRDHLLYANSIIIGRILVELPAFSWMKNVLPTHIHHAYLNEMTKKSKVFQLPLQFKNEAKHEDCVEILDRGSEDVLHKFKVPIGGDQLTRVRFQEAKNLRSLATSREKRFEDLHPTVIEIWHTKQDLLEKAYKELYSSSSLRQPGTLFFFKSRLQKSDINGKVKGRFQQHMDLLLVLFKHLVIEQALEFFGMDSRQSQPAQNYPSASSSAATDKKKIMFEILNRFISHYKYCDFNLEDKIVSESTPLTYKIIGKTKEGKLMLQPELTIQHAESTSTEEVKTDKLFNYCMNLCDWAIHIEELNDTAREGDLERIIPNSMMNILFFFSHSPQSKYFIENVDYILKTEYMLSPLEKLRVLEGTFVNKKGGKGNNVEADLVQEYSVRNQKSLIKHLLANKTEKAILRSTGAADSVADILESLDECLGIRQESVKHARRISEKDEEVLEKTLRTLRPFSYTQDRECIGFKNIKQSPLHKIDKQKLENSLLKSIRRLSYGMQPEPKKGN